MRALAFLPLLVVSAVHAQDLAKLRREVEAARKASPVPGLSLAIVKDGKVVFAEGFGWADVAKRRRATADTVYEIGSSTKTFTGLLAAQAQAEGKLSLKDRPSKYLPLFRLKDPQANERITLEDMLSHRSGLPRTDLVWYASDLSGDDLLRLVAEEEPTAPLGAAWQYQNLMFLFSGMIEEKVYGKPFDAILRERFFGPLGMAHSASTYAATKAEPNLATGYSGGGSPLALKPIDRIAPAGSISSTVVDMARYARMLLAGGEFEGKRLFAKEAIEETRKPRIPMPGGAYGLGWFLGEVDGDKRVFHGGNIDGYSALITLVPAKGIAVVALSNGNNAGLPTEATNLALDALTPKKAEAKREAFAEATAGELGVYRSATPPIELSFAREGKAVSFTQNGRKFPLELVGPKRYTFQKALYVTFGVPPKEAGGRPTVKIEQGPMTLLLAPSEPYKAPISAEALLAKTVEAQGGAEAIRRHVRSVVRYHAKMPSDAVSVYGVRYRRDAVSEADFSLMYALNRRFAEIVQTVDGTSTTARASFQATERKAGPGAADELLAANALADVEPARFYRSLAIVREDKVGGVPVYVLEKTPFVGGKVTDYVSKADGRVLRRTSPGGSSADYSDFRTIDGLTLPFRSVTSNAAGGKVVEEIDSIRFDEYVPDWPWRGF